MNLAGCHFPDQPGIHRSKQKFTALSPLAGPLHMIQDPSQLRRGKIRVWNQAGLLVDVFSESICNQLRNHIRGPAALPHDRIVHRHTGPLIPDNRRLSLIRDPYRSNVLRSRANGSHRLRRHADL